MKIEKQLAAVMLCLAVLWASRFGPYSCDLLAGFPIGGGSSWQASVAAGGFLIIFLFVPAYDFIAFVTYRLGWDRRFDPIDVFAGEFPRPGQLPISQKIKSRVFYPLDLAIVIFLLLPGWTKVAYCG